jgi:hypothetical protein
MLVPAVRRGHGSGRTVQLWCQPSGASASPLVHTNRSSAFARGQVHLRRPPPRRRADELPHLARGLGLGGFGGSERRSEAPKTDEAHHHFSRGERADSTRGGTSHSRMLFARLSCARLARGRLQIPVVSQVRKLAVAPSPLGVHRNEIVCPCSNRSLRLLSLRIVRHG